MANRDLDCDVVVVGAGLSGLTSAVLLCEAGLRTIVLEAGTRLGGRIRSLHRQSNGHYAADLGPTWVWPEYQPIISEWLGRLNVETFDQFDDGDAIIDLGEEIAVRRQHVSGQYGIRRIDGGPQALIDALSARLPAGVVETGQRVTGMEMKQDAVVVKTGGPHGQYYRSDRVIAAAPLRVMAETISWPSNLDTGLMAAMTRTPTWMAAQAKAVALYKTPFWRHAGLSGRVVSQPGPLVELHDHSFRDGSQAALFGFIGWPPAVRKARREDLRQAINDQLVRCFGEEARNYSELQIEDWALNALICSEDDLSQPPEHPDIAPDILRRPQYDGRLFLRLLR